MVIIVFGLPGSGKSYFARTLANTLKASYINSDTIRDKFPPPIKHSREEKNIVYDIILNRMLTTLHAGKTVIIDATFYKEDLRRRFTSYVREPGMLHFIEIVADELLIKNRLSRRKNSHADYNVYKLIQADWDPAMFPHLTIQSTDDNINEMISKALEYLQPYQVNKTAT
jgi:predicted kinase